MLTANALSSNATELHHASQNLLAGRSREHCNRAGRNARRDVIGRLDDLQANGEAVAEKLASVEDQSEELEQSLGRLRVSLARLAVLRAALDDAQIAFGRVIAVVPRK